MTMLNKAGMLAEIVVLSMLNNKQSVILQQIAFQNHIRKFWYFLQYIRRISKDKVELFPTLTYIFEDITLDRNGRKILQLVNEFLYELEVQRVLFNADNAGTPTGKQFTLSADEAIAALPVLQVQ